MRYGDYRRWIWIGLRSLKRNGEDKGSETAADRPSKAGISLSAILPEKRAPLNHATQGVPGYKNLTVLVPSKKDRIFEVHPLSPSAKELALLSKRQFDQRVKNWKKALHEWDNIESAEQIPRRLWSKSMIYEHHAQSIAAKERQWDHRERRRWTPKKKKEEEEESHGPKKGEPVYSTS